MQNTVNNFDQRYSVVTPLTVRRFSQRYYSCKDCGELVSDMSAHNQEHFRRDRDCDPVIVFAKMSEIVTILWGEDGNRTGTEF